MKKVLIAATASAVMLSTIGLAEACSSVVWESNHGVVLTRTMDWMESTKPVLMTVREGSIRNLHGVQTGDTYKVKHDYLAIAGYGDLIGEGVNKHGLQVSVQYYRPMTLNKAEKGEVSQVELGGYLLSNYTTVEEVLEALPTLKVGSAAIPELPEPPAFHYGVTDASGDRIVIQYDDDGMNVYRGEDARVMTNNPGQDVLLESWHAKKGELAETGGPDRNFNLEAGNTSAEQRFVFSNYFVSQLKESHSPTHAMMAVEGTTFKVPQQAAYAGEGAMDTYATEYSITYNLDSGDVVFKYTGDDKWSQDQWNFKQILSSNKNVKLPLY